MTETSSQRTSSSTIDRSAANRISGPSDKQIELMDILSHVYLRHGLYEQARIMLAGRDMLSPNNPRTLLALGLAQIRTSQAQAALITLDRLAQIESPAEPFTLLLTSQALQSLGQQAESIKLMKAYVAARLGKNPEGSSEQDIKEEMVRAIADAVPPTGEAQRTPPLRPHRPYRTPPPQIPPRPSTTAWPDT